MVEVGKNDPKYRCASRMIVLACGRRNLHCIYTNWQTVQGDDTLPEAGICTANMFPGGHAHFWVSAVADEVFTHMILFRPTCLPVMRMVSSGSLQFIQRWLQHQCPGLGQNLLLCALCAQPCWLFTAVILKLLLSSACC